MVVRVGSGRIWDGWLAFLGRVKELDRLEINGDISREHEKREHVTLPVFFPPDLSSILCHKHCAVSKFLYV